jgi:hypothetical protein
MKKTHSLTPRSCHFRGHWGCHGAGGEKATGQIHGDAQNGHSRVPPDRYWSAWMSAHGGYVQLGSRAGYVL